MGNATRSTGAAATPPGTIRDPDPTTDEEREVRAAATHERELTGPVQLCTPDGRLNPDAVGWSRRPVVEANLRGPWGRAKRWEYWCVTGGGKAVAFTYANVDYLSLASIWVVDLESGFERERGTGRPGPAYRLTTRVDHGRYRVVDRALSLAIEEHPEATVLRGGWQDAELGRIDIDLTVARPPGHEVLNVVVPWSARRFQLTSKQNTRPARGTVHIGAQRWEFGPHNDSFGTLDHGRGVWPYRTRWNWGSGSGTVDGRTVGLQLGGKWTVGTGSTENALCIDGRLSKVGEELAWQYDWDRPRQPWRVWAPSSRAIDLTLVPIHDRYRKVDGLVARNEVHQVFGHWEGTVVTAEGERLAVHGVPGWAEESRSRW